METRYFVEFIGANGKPRYVGEGATMPYRKEEARLFETKQDARAAYRLIGAHHRASDWHRVRSRRVIISKPVYMSMLGL